MMSILVLVILLLQRIGVIDIILISIYSHCKKITFLIVHNYMFSSCIMMYITDRTRCVFRSRFDMECYHLELGRHGARVLKKNQN
jgi:hypothetical protein